MNKPSVPPPNSHGHKDIPNIPSKNKSKVDASAYKKTDEEHKYIWFTFKSQKDYLTFKYKFLSRMANMMIQQIKKENERMIKALKKMKEHNQ